MTQEDKELLLKDLGTRLAYHPVIYGKEGISTNEGILTSVTTSGVFINTKGGSTLFYFIEEIKPYLRPLCSMTKKEAIELCTDVNDTVLRITKKNHTCILSIDQMDWLNAHHFDYRDLIEKGLALEAPKGMYNF